MTGDQQPQTFSSAMQRLPSAVEQLAKDFPNNTWITVPRDAELTQGWRDLTYRHLAHAVDGMSKWIESTFGLGRRNVDVAAYIGLNDVLYGVAEMALMKAGYKALLPSPRNSQEGQASLFKTTKCSILIHSKGVDSHVESIKSALPDLRTLEIPSFDDLCQFGSKDGEFSEVPSGDHDQVLVLHTSGSTGLPKPIYHTHASIYTIAAAKELHAPEGRQNAQDAFLESDKLLLSPAPFFHMMGQAILWRTIQCRAPLAILPAEKPPNGELITKVIEQTKPSKAIFPPSLLEQVTETPGGMDALRNIEHVFYGGGPLATGTGDKLTQITSLVSIIGSTEAGLIPTRIPVDKEDWKYFEWAPGSGVDMEPDADGLCELVIKPADKKYQAVFYTFPGIKEWRTKDLFERHPTKKGLWLYKGRKDDVLVLSNGEKFNPVGFEKTLESHALVKGALVVGQARFQTGLLIEPEWSFVPEDQDPEKFLDEVWPLIEQANAASPAHGRVWRSKVAIAKRDKSFKRAPKGSIIRRQTVALYEKEIEALYSNESSGEELGKLPADADIESTKKFLRQLLKLKGIDLPENGEADEQDLFSFGMDSLQVLALASTLSHATGGTISPRDVYGNPNVAALAQFLRGSSANSDATAQAREDAMAKMVEKYNHDLVSRKAPAPKERPQKHTYILTGSTGSLGNYLLENLISSAEVGHVYCLNRSADAESRQRKSFESRGVSTGSFSKATFLAADFSKDRFGLDPDVYEMLLRSVDIFIHNAWSVDFNLTLQTYEKTHIAGTRRCVDFSLQSKYRTQIVFISSIASVGSYPVSHPGEKEVPEEIFEDHSVPLPQGYGESKHVASLILADAAREAGVPATIVRAGQLAGPSSGQGAPWNAHEWLPSIVISSKAMGVVPEKLGNQDIVDWVPMDLAAKSVIDIAISQAQTSDLAVAHLVNPRIVSWSALVPAVKESLEKETGREMRVVSFREWLDELKSSSQTTEEVEKKPGIKLIDFYEGLLTEGGGLPALKTEKTRVMSRTVDGMKAVDAELMRKWVAQWRE